MAELFGTQYTEMSQQNFKTIRGYATAQDIVDCVKKANFQRVSDTQRIEQYADFLETTPSNHLPYTPEIILGLIVKDDIFQKLNNKPSDAFSSIKITSTITWRRRKFAFSKGESANVGTLEVLTKDEDEDTNEIVVIDGLHRLKAFKENLNQIARPQTLTYALLIFNEADSWLTEYSFYHINSNSKPLTSRENLNAILKAISNTHKTSYDPFITYMQTIKNILEKLQSLQKTNIMKINDIEYYHTAEIFYRMDTNPTIKAFKKFEKCINNLISLLHKTIRDDQDDFQNIVGAIIKIYLQEDTPPTPRKYEEEIKEAKNKITILKETFQNISKLCTKNKVISQENKEFLKKKDDYNNQIMGLIEHIAMLEQLKKEEEPKKDKKIQKDKNNENIKSRVKHFVFWVNRLYDTNILTDTNGGSGGTLDIYNIYIRELRQWKRKIFVAMPFNEECETHWQAIETAVAKFNQDKSLSQHLQATRIDRVKYGFSIEILKTIKDEISTAGLLIADLTDNNPNVYHELGFFLGSRNIVKETVHTQCILIAREKRIAPLPKTDNYTGERSKDTHYPNPTFDVNNFAQIRFEKTKDLSDELYRKFTDIWEI